MRPLDLPTNRPRAFTLIELLIVVLIAMLLTAAAIPLLRPAFQDRKVREATRQLNAMFANAKASATERNRPFGVWFDRTPGNLNQCLQVFICEVPPPYSGDVLYATVVEGATESFTDANGDGFWDPGEAWVDSISNGRYDRRLDFVGNNAATLIANPGGLLLSGELCLIRFDHKGDFYQCYFDGAYLSFAAPMPKFLVNGVPYQIYRNPRKTT